MNTEHDLYSRLLLLIQRKEAVVGVIGLGYVGLPLLLTFVEKGFRVVGLDVDGKKTQMLMQGQSYIRHIPSQRIASAMATGRMSATDRFEKSQECDALIIAVPTPLTANREPDMSYIVSTCETIGRHVRPGQLIVLESTTYPGTTDEIVVPILEKSGLKVDQELFVGFSPEREDPSRTDFTTATIPKVVGATSRRGLDLALALYGQIVIHTVAVSSARVAEATKILENTFRAVNIALVNELKVAFTRMGIDIWEVIEAAKTKPFGFMPFYPGPGLGGHCIPIDPFYLTWKAREYGISTRFIELAGEINSGMPDYVVGRAMEVLNLFGKPMKGARILIMGLAYKPNVDDDRESPSYRLIEKLEDRGALVSYHDPYIPVIRPTREYLGLAGRRSVEIGVGYDLVIVATGHDVFRETDFKGLGAPVLDTRNIVASNGDMTFKA
jgi:UDP-N-acetyl-D-glucosamine dehydrogenase